MLAKATGASLPLSTSRCRQDSADPRRRRPRPVQRGDRRGAVPQRGDREDPRQSGAPQAGAAQPRSGRGARLRHRLPQDQSRVALGPVLPHTTAEPGPDVPHVGELLIRRQPA